MEERAGLGGPPLMGGYRAAFEIQQGSKIHHLAAFSLQNLKEPCAASNSMACGRIADASLLRVSSAQTQVVAGTNYVIEAETSTYYVLVATYYILPITTCRLWPAPTT